ncbi:hypothetical protein ACRALDRAFT_2059297 [Sodiomyces alcalophilus JCM 7366]|uniref:uncharacterized protein n=1 Tax=Sodiomyces alcalophilus JCM 7366 TaxID=591952 RepID=UPI0039B48DA8
MHQPHEPLTQKPFGFPPSLLVSEILTQALAIRAAILVDGRDAITQLRHLGTHEPLPSPWSGCRCRGRTRPGSAYQRLDDKRRGSRRQPTAGKPYCGLHRPASRVLDHDAPSSAMTRELLGGLRCPGSLVSWGWQV